ncbi:unnamed protein product, partial [marine sediment metagenome]
KLTLPGVGKILRFNTLGNSLIIFASTGVYALNGGLGETFKATGHVLEQLTEQRLISPAAIVTTSDTLYYWTEEGISFLSTGASPGVFDKGSITEGKYEQGYFDIIDGMRDRENARGFLDRANNYIEWSYSHNVSSNRDWGHSYILRFNLKTQAFTTYQFSQDSNQQTINATANNYGDEGSRNEPLYLCNTIVPITTRRVQWHQLNDSDLEDFGGSDYSVYGITWSEHVGAPHLRKQALNLITYFRRTEVNWISAGTFDNLSAANCTVYWDWADHDV